MPVGPARPAAGSEPPELLAEAVEALGVVGVGMGGLAWLAGAVAATSVTVGADDPAE
ncbi:MAG: hypothetical protein WAU75_04735 [Solirubrobacteraceae bacterium]